MTRREQGNANLLNVARALRESPNPDTFTMLRYQQLNERRCGTPACALGHYAFRSDLQSFLKPDPVAENFLLYVKPSSAYPWVDYDDDEILEHFDINDDETYLLFGSSGCNDATTPLEAAEYIEAFVRGRS